MRVPVKVSLWMKVMLACELLDALLVCVMSKEGGVGSIIFSFIELLSVPLTTIMTGQFSYNRSR